MNVKCHERAIQRIINKAKSFFKKEDLDTNIETVLKKTKSERTQELIMLGYTLGQMDSIKELDAEFTKIELFPINEWS